MLIAVHGYTSSQPEAETLSRQPHQRCEDLDILPAYSERGTAAVITGKGAQRCPSTLSWMSISTRHRGAETSCKRQSIFDQYARVLFTANSDEEASLVSAN